MRALYAITAVLATALPAAAQTRPTQEQVVSRLSEFTDSLAKHDSFSGVVVLARNGTRVFEKTYGYADREARRPNTVETRFNLGSINKMFTSTSIRQLVAAGKLSLDSTFIHYLPDYPNRELASRVKVSHLLWMTAGLGGNIFGTPASGKRSDIRQLSDFLPLFVNEAPLFDPGTKEQYCNVCFVVLGLIIERVSGQSYYDYVRTHIYDPAGMKNTGHTRSDALTSREAIGYTRGDDPGAKGPLRRNTPDLPGIGSSAGGGYSTAGDLLMFLAALREHRVPSGPAAGSVGIAGGSGGMNAVLEGGLGGEYDLVVLANMDPPAAERISAMVRGMFGRS